MSLAQKDIDELIAKSLAGETSVAEEKQLADWLEKDPANPHTFAQFKKVFEEVNKFYETSPEVKAINVEKEWSQFLTTLPEQHKGKDNIRPMVQNKFTTSWMRIAAALVLIAVSGFVVNYFISQNNEDVFETASSTLPVILPDGSHIILNSHSRISYSKSFGKNQREVTLQGEAFFEVAHDAAKPFVITANAIQVEVLGTSFDVSAYDKDKEVSVTVETGKVKFSVRGTNEEIKLTAGQRGHFTKANKQLASATNTDINFLSWKTRKLVFVENDLRSVIETINKTYGSNITIATTLSASCEVTVSFDGQTLEAVLKVLKSTLNLTYREKDGRIEIVDAGC